MCCCCNLAHAVSILRAPAEVLTLRGLLLFVWPRTRAKAGP